MKNSWPKQTPVTVVILVLLFQTILTTHGDQSRKDYIDIQVGVIVDMGSWAGKVIGRSITMAISDFYAVNPHYTTRIVINMRDTKGEPLLALSSTLDLLEKTKVQAIIGPESTVESRVLEVLKEKANVPILTFSTSPLSNHIPYFLQIAQDETTQFKGIAAMIESFKWNDVVLISEDSSNGREMATYAANAFRETKIRLTYTSHMSTSSSNDQIKEELYKLQTMQATMFVIHTPPSLTSNLFSLAKELGMMGEGYMWIVTSKTTNFFNAIDTEAVESMQGAVGFKSYFPKSKELRNLVLRLRKEYYDLNPNMEFKDIDSNVIWAYDAVYALAMAVEKVQTTVIGASLQNQISRTNFHGLGGEFKLVNGKTTTKAMEVINVIGKDYRRVGFWMDGGEFVKEIRNTNCSSNSGLQSIIWPGGTATIPTRRMLQMNGKKLRFLVPVFGTFPNLIQMAVDPRTNLSTVSGFCGDVFNVAFNALKYDVDIEFVPFHFEEGTYNDLIYKVYFEEFDGAVGDITITSNRSHYVDFTLPFSDLGVGTLARNAKKSMWIFLDPLSADLWFTTAGFFLFLGFVIWFIEHRTNQEFQGSTRHQIGTTLWFAFSTLVYAHREKLHSNLSRIVVTIWVFVVLVLTSSYTATLSSLLTVQQIASKEGLVQFQRNSLVRGAVLNNLPFTNSIKSELTLPDEYAEALRSGRVGAIIDEILYIKSVLALYSASEFSLVGTASITNGFSFVFKKGSPLTIEMSTEIAKLREHGILKALEDKWLKRQSSMMSADSSPPPPTILNLYGFRGLFLVSGVSMVLALLVSSFYIVHENWYQWYGKSKMEILRSLLRRSPVIHAQDDDVETTV